MAAVTHPRFKLSWIDDADMTARSTCETRASAGCMSVTLHADVRTDQQTSITIHNSRQR